ncbi:MAG: hypothetical protein Q8P02_02400, partial [Candidatus Micrarchaeota archaeon]|nr:hypothetical protein [Candidatus Micrarchaeota archaeon]
FPLVDPLLNAEMKSTGETMAFGKTFAEAYLKALSAAGERFGKSVLVESAGEKQKELETLYQASGLELAKTYEDADFVVSLDEGEPHAKIRRRCVRDRKTFLTSLFAAKAVAESLKENPVFSLVALSDVHKKAATFDSV